MSGDPHAPDDSDALLVARSATGDHRAFAILVRRHIRSATLFAAQLTGDRDDAEDLVQRAFTVVYERAAAFDLSKPFSPWLYGIMRALQRNVAIRALRRRRLWARWGSRDKDLEVQPEAIDAGVDFAETVRVYAALQALSPMQRACFDLVALRDVPIAEVAAMHAIAESTVRQHVFRARQELRRMLSQADE